MTPRPDRPNVARSETTRDKLHSSGPATPPDFGAAFTLFTDAYNPNDAALDLPGHAHHLMQVGEHHEHGFKVVYAEKNSAPYMAGAHGKTVQPQTKSAPEHFDMAVTMCHIAAKNASAKADAKALLTCLMRAGSNTNPALFTLGGTRLRVARAHADASYANAAVWLGPSASFGAAASAPMLQSLATFHRNVLDAAAVHTQVQVMPHLAEPDKTHCETLVRLINSLPKRPVLPD